MDFLSNIKILHIRLFCTLWKDTNVINHLIFHRFKELIWKKQHIVIKPSWPESSLGRWFKKDPKHTDIIIKWSLRESEIILMNEAAATIYTRLTATAESLLIIPKVNSHMRFSPWVKSLRLWGFMIQNQQYQLSTIKMFFVFCFHHKFSSFICYDKESWVLTKFLKIYWYDAVLSLH